MTSLNPSAFARSAFAWLVVLDMACFAPRARQLRHRVAYRSPDRWCQNGFAWTKTSQGKSHLRGEIRDGNTCSAHVIDTVRYQAKIFFPYSNPLAVGSVFKSAIGAPEHHA